MTFISTFGRMPNTWPIFFITVFAGLSEGLGLTLFVPLIEFMGGTEGDKSRLFGVFRDLYASVGLPFNLLSTLVGIVVLVSGGFSLVLFQRRLLADALARCRRDIRAEIFKRLLESTWSHLAKQSQGEIVNQLLIEAGRGSAALQMQIAVVSASIQVVILACISAALAWQLVLAAFVFAGLIVVATRPLLRRAAVLGEKTNTANREFSFHTVDYLKGVRLIKATGSEHSVLDRIGNFNERLCQVNRQLDYNTVLLDFLLQVSPVLIVAVVIAFAHEFVGLAPSHILVFLLLLARIAPRVADIQLKFENYSGFLPGLKLIDNAIAAAARSAEPMHVGGMKFDRLHDAIELDAVRFRYPDSDNDVINEISLRIPRQQTIAIVGTSGAGKSTLIDLIVGLREPEAGRILIDDTALNDIDLLSWRNRIGYVTQDIVIFNDTLRANLLFARPDASEEEIHECLATAHLDEVVSSMPEKLDTVLGEGGVRLSGGQRQRLALARALIAKPELLLLDEATSALDHESERLVQEALATIAHRFTTVIVAHRLSTVRSADVVYVMEGGRIIESGSYRELFASGGRLLDDDRLRMS